MRLRSFLRYLLPLLALLAMVPLSLWYGLAARFAPDDAMNLGQVLRDGWEKLLRSQVDFLHSTYRPLGGLFYLSVYKQFGLNPLPYRIVLHAALAVNVWLAFRLAWLLSRSHAVAALTATGFGYHAAQFNLHFETSVVYDVLCTFFYLLALCLYVGPRVRRQPLGLARGAAIAAAYVAAMNAKEMAVSLPVALLLFEAVYFRRLSLRAVALPGALGLLTGLYIWGRLRGPDALGQMNGYVPQLGVGAWLEARAHQAAELLYRTRDFGPREFLVFLGGMLLLALLTRRRWVWWAVGFWVIAALPVDFIRPLRGGANLYLPLFGYALLVAALLVAVSRRLIRKPRARMAVLSLLALLYVGKLYRSRGGQGPPWVASQELTWNYIQQLRAVPGLRAGQSIVFLNDPFEVWDMYFLTQIVTDDPAPNITLQRMLPQPLTEAELAGFDRVLTVENGRVRLIR